MNIRILIRRNVAVYCIVLLLIVACVGSILGKNNEGKRQLECINKYLQQEADIQIKRIPEWYSASLSAYDVQEISIPSYWLESTDGEPLQNSCYYFQFHTSIEALEIWGQIEKKEDFVLIDSGIFYVADADGNTKDILRNWKNKDAKSF